MPNSDFQRHSFLGGEISPSLYERADMDKFGKWFSKAENIRFRETGAFRNRCGFVKVADTKYNQQGQIIKLLSFAFNDEESFMVELGPSYARFYRNGQPIIVDEAPYEIPTLLAELSVNDLKYAQSGDTVFITDATYGIFELIRLKSDGTEWEFKRFSAEMYPMKEQNENVNDTISASQYIATSKRISLDNPNATTYSNVVFTFNNNQIYTSVSDTLFSLTDGITAAVKNVSSDYEVLVDSGYMYIFSLDALVNIPDFSLTFDGTYLTSKTISVDGPTGTLSSTATLDCSLFLSISNINIYSRGTSNDAMVYNASFDVSGNTLADSYNKIRGKGSFYQSIESFQTATHSSPGCEASYENKTITHTSNTNIWGVYGHSISATGQYYKTVSYSYSSEASPLAQSSYYNLTSVRANAFLNIQKDDCILIKNNEDTQQLTGSYSAAGTYTLGPIKSDGNWRLYTLGNWVGNVVIQYSTDNQLTWVDCYKWASQDANDTPANINTSGALTADDLVWFRAVATVTSTGTKPLQLSFTADSFTVNSYYRIISKSSDTSVMAKCIKNDVGTFSDKYEWRLPAFSNSEGWPQTVAFYQNRLFFGKDYIVYGSRSNDFWDFYEPTKLQADDPVTMSLLSQKVNTIRNLVTQRSFFTFTAGGEFGIGSEGALTQNDKYLKPFSANGSATCNPVLISDVILFVDKSYNSIRALKYALEADGYEAPDITLTLRALLENERIISSDIIYEEKEALFLSDTGTIWVLKYITDQNVLSWSHWKHAFGKITNICVVPHGAKHDLYIAVEVNGKKWIEILNPEEYMDTVQYFDATEDTKVTVSGIVNSQKAIIQGDKRYFVTVDSNNQVETPDDHTQPFKVGSVYTSTATLLSPVAQSSEYAHNNYELKSSFKVFFYYLNSYGFKVGIEEDKKEDIEWQPIDSDIDDEVNLTSGKKSVLIESSFDSSARLTFVQQEPYPMEVCDVLVQTDVGGK